MTLERPHTHLRVVWEPQLPRNPFRRRPWEQATIVETSVSGALVQAHAHRAIRRGTRISIALGGDRGVVAVRRVDAAPNPAMSFYGVEFVWLDPDLQAQFDDIRFNSGDPWRY